MLPMLPKVSVIIACYNEQLHINDCLHSLVHQSYPNREIIVIDGSSSDDTYGICHHYSRTYGVKLLSNPKRHTPISWNMGIRHATGDLIMICGAHSTYPGTYISDHVAWHKKLPDAYNIGGMISFVPTTTGTLSDAMTICKSDKFGTGKSDFRITSNSTLIKVDTVFGGCYKRCVFSRIGHFNETLRYSSDLEFNLRLKSAGMATYLVPSITSTYFSRTTLLPFLKNAYKDGKWAVLPYKYSDAWDSSWRLIPMLFIITLPVSIIPYALLNMFRSLQKSISKRNALLFPALMLVFFVFHLSYGLGSARAVVELMED